MILAALSGILAILAFLPVKYSFIFAFFCLVPFFIFLKKETGLWRLILGTSIFRLMFGLGTVYYTLEPIFWLSSLFIFWGLPLSVFLVKKIKFPDWLFFIILPAIWSFWDLMEAQFSFIPTYVFVLGNSFGSSPFLGLAGLGGIITLTIFAAAINSILAAALSANKFSKKSFALSTAIALIVIADGLTLSNFLIQKNANYYSNLKNSLKIIAVSANEKFNSSQFNQLKDELSSKKADLIVLPEDILNGSTDKDFYKNLAAELKTNIATTLTVQTIGGRSNSTFLFNPDGKILGAHNKNRLTFIGEYWPFGNWQPSIFKRLKNNNPGMGDYAVFQPENPYIKGEKGLINMGPLQFASLICLEADYPFDLKFYKNMGAKFLINPTSNRWLGNIGENEFIYLATNLKKIESAWLKIPIVSAGIKDYAGIIYPDGKANLIYNSEETKNYSVLEEKIKY